MSGSNGQTKARVPLSVVRAKCLTIRAAFESCIETRYHVYII